MASAESNKCNIEDVVDSADMGLREFVVTKCCKHVDIGVAVMPALLFDKDAKNGYVYVDSTPKHYSTETSTRYAEIVRREFNAVVSILSLFRYVIHYIYILLNYSPFFELN
jgi:hypothetical protein